MQLCNDKKFLPSLKSHIYS